MFIRFSKLSHRPENDTLNSTAKYLVYDCLLERVYKQLSFFQFTQQLTWSTICLFIGKNFNITYSRELFCYFLCRVHNRLCLPLIIVCCRFLPYVCHVEEITEEKQIAEIHK